MNSTGFSLNARQREYERERAADGTAAHALAGARRRKGAQAETVVNGGISRGFLRDPALLPLADGTSRPGSGMIDSLACLRAGEPGNREAAHG
jgi:hypothetical protein